MNHILLRYYGVRENHPNGWKCSSGPLYGCYQQYIENIYGFRRYLRMNTIGLAVFLIVCINLSGSWNKDLNFFLYHTSKIGVRRY